jgi:hypothetical protein
MVTYFVYTCKGLPHCSVTYSVHTCKGRLALFLGYLFRTYLYRPILFLPRSLQVCFSSTRSQHRLSNSVETSRSLY